MFRHRYHDIIDTFRSRTVKPSNRLSRVCGCFCGLASLGLPFSVDIQNDLRLAAPFMSIRLSHLSLVGWFDGSDLG